MELAIIIAIVVFVLVYRGTVDPKQIYDDNKELVNMLKEKDYDFLVRTKYGEDANIEDYFLKRLKNTSIVLVIGIALVLFNFSVMNLIIAAAVVGLIYKLDYIDLKNNYKKNLNQIDQLLPYYLKNIEVLAQHYTIPVAISRSIETAPPVFRDGLRRLIAKIDAGDSSIDPYTDFAKEYPVKDSMRMMRLLYRLSIGAQDNKQEQLMSFSKSVSSLQNKARVTMYANRLSKMEKKTMIMLICTGGGTMLVMLIAMMMNLSA